MIKLGFYRNEDDIFMDWDMKSRLDIDTFHVDNRIILSRANYDYIPIYYDEEERKIYIFEYTKKLDELQRYGMTAYNIDDDPKTSILLYEHYLLKRNANDANTLNKSKTILEFLDYTYQLKTRI